MLARVRQSLLKDAEGSASNSGRNGVRCGTLAPSARPSPPRAIRRGGPEICASVGCGASGLARSSSSRSTPITALSSSSAAWPLARIRRQLRRPPQARRRVGTRARPRGDSGARDGARARRASPARSAGALRSRACSTRSCCSDSSRRARSLQRRNQLPSRSREQPPADRDRHHEHAEGHRAPVAAEVRIGVEERIDRVRDEGQREDPSQRARRRSDCGVEQRDQRGKPRQQRHGRRREREDGDGGRVPTAKRERRTRNGAEPNVKPEAPRVPSQPSWTRAKRLPAQLPPARGRRR